MFQVSTSPTSRMHKVWSFHFISRHAMDILAVYSILLLGCTYLLWKIQCDYRKLSTLPLEEPNNKCCHLCQFLGAGSLDSIYGLDQESEILQEYTRLRFLTPPSRLPYDLPENPDPLYKEREDLIKSLFKQDKKRGTFIEAAPFDGVVPSNSLYFEKSLNWTGLLVSCNPFTLPFLKMTNRKAWISEACLSPSKRMQTITTDLAQIVGPAVPLYAQMTALNLTSIDYLSLNVEGLEFVVVKTIPFKKVLIKVMEINVKSLSERDKTGLKSFLESKSYEVGYEHESSQFFVHSKSKSKDIK